MLALWWIPLVLAALAAVTAQAPPRGWSTRIDLALAAVCGVGLALASHYWLVAHHMTHFDYTVTDLHEYCGTIEAMSRRDGLGVSPQRSKLAAALPALLAPRLGILGGLAAGSLVALGLTGAGLYLWGRALQGRVAGVLAVVCAAALSPVVIMARDLRFYPAMTAAFVLGAAGCALALRHRTSSALLFAGIGAGLCFLVDLRGLIWGLSFTALAGIAVVWGPPRRLPLRLLALALPLSLSWYAGRWAYEDTARPLERQVNVAKRLEDAGLEVDWALSDLPESTYVWGRTPVTGIPGTLHNLWLQAERVPSELYDQKGHWFRMEAFVRPWSRPGLLCLFLGLVGCARGPERLRRLLGFATLVPFAASMRSALQLDNIHSHYLALTAPGLAVVLGVGLGSAIWLLPGRPKGRAWTRELVWVGLVASMVVGVVPSPFSPTAAWRLPMMASYMDFGRMLDEVEETPDRGRTNLKAMDIALCTQGLQADVAEGIELDRFDPRSRP